MDTEMDTMPKERSNVPKVHMVTGSDVFSIPATAETTIAQLIDKVQEKADYELDKVVLLCTPKDGGQEAWTFIYVHMFLYVYVNVSVRLYTLLYVNRFIYAIFV